MREINYHRLIKEVADLLLKGMSQYQIEQLLLKKYGERAILAMGPLFGISPEKGEHNEIH